MISVIRRQEIAPYAVKDAVRQIQQGQLLALRHF